MSKARWVGLAGLLVLAPLVVLSLTDTDPTPMLGVYTWGPEVNTFRACGGTEVRWVQASPGTLRRLREAHQDLTGEPYQGILIEAYLRHSGDEPGGFALDYDGLIRVDSVLAIEATIPESCLDTTWALPGRRPSHVPR